MFGKIVYIGDSEAHVENLQKEASEADLMNMNVIFEESNQRILGEVFELGNELCHRPSPHSIPIERPSVSSSGPVSISSSNESASCCNFFSSAGSRT